MTPRQKSNRGGLRATLILWLTTVALCGVGHKSAAAVSDSRLSGTPSKATEAGRHFHRGIDLYNDGDLSAAAVEFSRAYQIVPTFKILYNLGQIAYERQDYLTARDSFRRYLEDGRDQIAPDRRRQVEEDVRRLDQRIGRLEIDTREDGSDVLVDGVTVGTTPLWTIAANVGHRRVEIVSQTGVRHVRAVDVVGGETTHVKFADTVASLSSPPDEPSLALQAGPSKIAPLPQSLLSRTPAERQERSRPSSSHGLWLAWSATGLLGVGAVVTGALAFSAAQALRQGRDTFPVTPGSLDPYGRRAKLLGWTSDGLLAGTVLMAAVSSYLTFRAPADESSRDDDQQPEQEDE